MNMVIAPVGFRAVRHTISEAAKGLPQELVYRLVEIGVDLKVGGWSDAYVTEFVTDLITEIRKLRP